MSNDTKLLSDLPDPEDHSTRALDAIDEAMRNAVAAERVHPMPRSSKTVLVIFADNPKTLQFELEDALNLGRRSDTGQQPEVDFAPFGGFPAGISRLHARLSRTENGLMIEDLGSRNGTFIDGDRLEPNIPTLIRNGQSLKMGGLQGWIFFEGLK